MNPLSPLFESQTSHLLISFGNLVFCLLDVLPVHKSDTRVYNNTITADSNKDFPRNVRFTCIV